MSWKEVRPTTIQKMHALEGMHPNNASTSCMGEKMLTRLLFLKNFRILGANRPPSYMPMPPPPHLERRIMPPPVNGPSCGKKKLGLGGPYVLATGGGRHWIPVWMSFPSQ